MGWVCRRPITHDVFYRSYSKCCVLSVLKFSLANSAHTMEGQAMFFLFFSMVKNKNFCQWGLGRFGPGVNTPLILIINGYLYMYHVNILLQVWKCSSFCSTNCSTTDGVVRECSQQWWLFIFYINRAFIAVHNHVAHLRLLLSYCHCSKISHQLLFGIRGIWNSS